MSTKQSKNANNALFIIIILTVYYMLCVAIFAAITVATHHENKNYEQLELSLFKKILEPASLTKTR